MLESVQSMLFVFEVGSITRLKNKCWSNGGVVLVRILYWCTQIYLFFGFLHGQISKFKSFISCCINRQTSLGGLGTPLDDPSKLDD